MVYSPESKIMYRDSNNVTCFHGFGCSLRDRDWTTPSGSSDRGPPSSDRGPPGGDRDPPGTEPEGDIEVVKIKIASQVK